MDCQYKHFYICPMARDYMKDNVLIGTGKNQLLLECSHILPWHPGFQSKWTVPFKCY